ncbi:pilus (MSHA type) biogenesis protein MshL [Ectothiorhodospiraceae bacterium 2226]|nr:pilus (MSHA type) biogenesis protein MshL [Ectothiorhodospiraceae bacterium 2226]
MTLPNPKELPSVPAPAPASTSYQPHRVGMALALGGLLLAGCQTVPEREAPRGAQAVLAEIDQALERPPAPEGGTEPPPEVSQALLPPLQLATPGARSEEVESRFDIKVSRAPAAEFFMGLVEGTRYNMVVHPQVAGEITIDLKDVTVPEVMELVRSVYGYEFQRTANHYQVLPAGLRSRVFQVNYLDITRAGSSQTRVSSGQVSDTRRSRGRGRPFGALTADDLDDDRGTLSGSRIDTQSESNFWLELERALAALVGNGDGRNVVVNRKSGVVVVRALPEDLRAVEEFLQATQATVQRQVILEAKIIEVELSEGFQTGINWAAIGTSRGRTAVGGQTGGSTIFNLGESNTAGQSGVFNPNDPTLPRDLVASAFGGVFALGLNTNSFTAFLEMLETQGQVHVLSSPRVSTVNNQKAVIKVGSDAFFVTDVQTNTFLGTTTATSQNANVELTPFFSGVALDVIPQISADGDIILHIHPTVSEVSEQIKDIGIATDTTLSVPLAISSIRESDTVVRARNGQVIVIGGLMQTSTRNEVAGVPGLSRLPVVGGLFRHTRQVARKSELVILLQPTVVEGDAQWAQELQRSSDTIRGLHRR